MSIAKRVFVGGGTRKSRLHDERGQLVPLGRLIRNGSRALVGEVARHAFKFRPARPWISYDATSYLKHHLTNQSRVLEFGSGMSTAWYASVAGQVISIEDYKPWFVHVETILQKSGISNVKYEYASTKDDYLKIAIDEAKNGYDLIMIDGNYRDECVDIAIQKLNHGGIIYYDNSDRGVDPKTGDTPKAIARLFYAMLYLKLSD
jgi:hypothetical protein